MFVNLTGRNLVVMSDDCLLLNIPRGTHELKLHLDAELDGCMTEHRPGSLRFVPPSELKAFAGRRIIVSPPVATFIKENALREDVYYVDDSAPDGDSAAKRIRLLRRCC